MAAGNGCGNSPFRETECGITPWAEGCRKVCLWYPETWAKNGRGWVERKTCVENLQEKQKLG